MDKTFGILCVYVAKDRFLRVQSEETSSDRHQLDNGHSGGKTRDIWQ